MHNYKFLLFTLLCVMAIAACTPKVGEQSTTTKPNPTTEVPTKPSEDFRKGVPAAGPAPTIELGTAEEFELKNGLKVIVVENHKLPRVSYQLFIDAPVLSEGESVGTAAIAGSLLNKGTTTRSKADIDEAVDYIGASLSSSESGLFASSLTKHADKLLEVMSDVLLNPSFPEAEFVKLKKQAISALAQEKDDANAIAGNVGDVLNYGKTHPYGEMTTEKTLEAIKITGAKAYYDNFFRPNIAYLVIVGDVNLEQAKAQANQYFGEWSGTAAMLRPSYPEVKKPAPTQMDFVDKTGAVQSVVNITYPIVMLPGSPDVIPTRVMNTAFGAYFRSRLNNNLREDKAYTYGARSAFSTDRLVAEFRAYASVRNEVTDSSIVEFLKEMNTIRTERMGQKELDIVKSVMSGSFAQSLESPETVARFALNTARYNLPADYYSTYLTKLAAVTSEDVYNMAQKYITPDNAHILVVGNKDEVADKLTPFTKDGKVNYYDVFGTPIKDEAMEIPAGMTAAKVLEDYANAIGGKANINAIKTMKTVMTGDTQMGQMLMTQVNSRENKFALMVGASGATIQKIVIADGKGKSSGMGGSEDLTGDKLKEITTLAPPFREAAYLENGYTAELKSLEMIAGQKAYKLIITQPTGKKGTEYYSLKSGLKIREIDTDGKRTTTYDFADYKEVEGVKVPHTMLMSGSMPFTIEMKVQTVEMNKPLEEAIFKF